MSLDTFAQQPTSQTPLLGNDGSGAENFNRLDITKRIRKLFSVETWKHVFAFMNSAPIFSLLPAVVVCALIWNVEAPQGLTPTSMHMFGVFCGVIVSILTSKYNISILVTLAILVLTLTSNLKCVTKDGISVDCSLCGKLIENQSKALSYKDFIAGEVYQCDPINSAFEVALSGFSSTIPWLVFSAFHIGKGIEGTGLARRVSLLLVSKLGRSLTGIGYAICGAEVLLAPFIPSNSARAGGIIFPISNSIIKLMLPPSGDEFSAEPNPISGYLMMISAYANAISSSMFLTSMAGNPIVSSRAKQVFGIEYGFAEWAMANVVPGLLLLSLLPFLVGLIFKPKIDMEEFQQKIRVEIQRLSPLTTNEKKLLGIMAFCLTFWMFEFYFRINPVIIAFITVMLLVIFEIVSWNEITSNANAWDTYYWLSIFILLANQLTELGISTYIGKLISRKLAPGTGDTGILSSAYAQTVILAVMYYMLMYMFSSTASRIVAFAGPFMEAAKSLNCCNPILFTSIIAGSGNLSNTLAPYTGASTVIYASSSKILYNIQPNVWFVGGFAFTIMVFLTFLTFGTAWYYLLGWI